MTWEITSTMAGPVELSDLGIVLTKTCPRRDLDLIGRENAERSNDVKLAIAKGWIKTIRKDAMARDGGMNPQAVQAVQALQEKVNEVSANQAEAVRQLEERNRKLEADLAEQRAQQAEAMAKQAEAMALTSQVLEHVKAFSDKFPLEFKTIHEAVKNVRSEQAHVAAEKEKISGAEAAADTEADLKAQKKILDAKEKRLQKNLDNAAKTVAGSSSDVKDVLDAMDEIGL